MCRIISSLFRSQKNTLTNTTSKVVVNHFNAPDVLLYIIDPKIYFTNNICDLPDIQFRTLTTSKKELTGKGSNKLKNIIYPIYKGNHHFTAYQELIPYEYIEEGEVESLCCNCLRKIREINNDYEGRLACKSCRFDCSRTHNIKLKKLNTI